MFIVYGITNIAGRMTIRDIDFMTADKNYLTLEHQDVTVEQFLEYEKLDSIDYILPGNGIVDLRLEIHDYYQTNSASSEILEGVLTTIEAISNEDIIAGRMPENDHEVVIDKIIYERQENLEKYGGIKKVEELLNRKVSCRKFQRFNNCWNCR